MKIKEMKDVFEYLRDVIQPENINEWIEYKNNMEKLFNELKPYFEEDEKKEYKAITEEDYERIDKVFNDVAKASNDFMKAYENITEKTVDKDGNPIPKVKEIVKNLNDQFFSKGFIEFKNIKPNPDIPLKDQLEDFRYLNVKLSDQDIKRLGGNQSSRLQMNVNIDGQVVKGVFTEKSIYDAKEEFGKIISAFAEKYPKYTDFYNSIDPKKFFTDGIYDRIDDKLLLQEDGAITDLELRQKAINVFLAKARFGQDILNKGEALSNDEGFYNSLLDFTAQINNVSTSVSFNVEELKLNNLERMDVRNSAMSAVATLIKVPDLVAKSRNLAVYDEVGKKITEGTFMEFAKGKDINNLAPVDEMRLMKDNNFENYLVKKQIANLQILDYICGNVDRHAGNMLYDVDPVTKNLKGITGIDNDSSFGKVVSAANKMQVRLPAINDMRVISEDMANTITNLTEGELKSTLHGYGLSEESIEAAWRRTVQLKDAIKNGKTYGEDKGILFVDPNETRPMITIMRDDDFKSVDLAYCAGRTKNYFATIDAVKKIATNREYENVRLTRKAYALSLGLKSAISKDQTQDFVNKAKQASPKWFASTRYKNFMAKLNDFHNQEIKGNDPLSLINKPKFDKMDELKKAIEVYKKEKIRDGFIDDNWNLKKKVTGKDLDRILLVKDTEKYVKRIEIDKEITQDMQAKHEADIKKVNDSKAFFEKNKNEQLKLVEDKLKAEGVDVSKKDDNALEAKSFENDKLDKIVVRKVGKVLVFSDDEDEDEFFADEEEIKNDIVNNNEMNKEL